MSEEPQPQVPEHGYWSLPSDDDGARERQTASQGVTTAAAGSSDADADDLRARTQIQAETQTLAAPAPRPPRAPTAALGWVALAIAVLFAIADVVAIVLAVERSWETAALVAQASNLGTAIAFVAGLFALRHRPGRRLGIAAMVLAVIANPFVLTHLLAFLGGS